MEIEANSQNYSPVLGTDPLSPYQGIDGANKAVNDWDENSSIWPYINRSLNTLTALRRNANKNEDQKKEVAQINEELDTRFTPEGRRIVEKEWIRRTHPFTELVNRQIGEIIQASGS